MNLFFQPAPTKRRLKQQSGATKDKVPHDVRQRYVNMFTEEFLKTTANVNEAFEKVSICHWISFSLSNCLDIYCFCCLMVDRLLLKRRLCTTAAPTNSNIWVSLWIHWRGWRNKVVFHLKVRLSRNLFMKSGKKKDADRRRYCFCCRWKWSQRPKIERKHNLQPGGVSSKWWESVSKSSWFQMSFKWKLLSVFISPGRWCGIVREFEGLYFDRGTADREQLSCPAPGESRLCCSFCRQ